jgi:hypothetical protein
VDCDGVLCLRQRMPHLQPVNRSSQNLLGTPAPCASESSIPFHCSGCEPTKSGGRAAWADEKGVARVPGGISRLRLRGIQSFFLLPGDMVL